MRIERYPLEAPSPHHVVIALVLPDEEREQPADDPETDNGIGDVVEVGRIRTGLHGHLTREGFKRTSNGIVARSGLLSAIR